MLSLIKPPSFERCWSLGVWKSYTLLKLSVELNSHYHWFSIDLNIGEPKGSGPTLFVLGISVRKGIKTLMHLVIRACDENDLLDIYLTLLGLNLQLLIHCRY